MNSTKMRQKVMRLSCLMLLLVTVDASAQCNEIVVHYSHEDRNFYAEAIVKLPTGNYLLAGSSDASGPSTTVFTEIDRLGEVLWSGEFNTSFSSEYTLRAKLDTEGKIIATGTRDGGFDMYILRFDPESREIEWLTRFDDFDDVQIRDVIDPGAPLPLFVVGFERNPPAPGLGGDVLFRHIDRNTGSLRSAPSNNLHLGSSESVSSMVWHQDQVFTVGRYVRSASFGDMRIAVSRLDSDGQEVWSRLLIQPSLATARLYGRDIVAVGDDLFFVGNGDPDGISLTETVSYFGKISVDGVLDWVRQIDIAAFEGQTITSLERSPEGFILSCLQKEMPYQRGVIRLDMNGNLIEAVNLGVGVDQLNSGIGLGQFDKLIVENDGYLVLHKSVRQDGLNVTTLFRLPFDTSFGTPCAGLEELEVSITDVGNPANESVDLLEYASPHTATTDSDHSSSEFILTDTALCPCLIEICDNQIDDDLNGLTDCDDPALADSCCCLIPVQPLILGPDSICAGDTTMLSLNTDYAAIEWSTGDTTNSIVVSEEAVYSVTVQDSCGNMMNAQWTLGLILTSAGSIDTVINPGEVISINGQDYDTAGVFSQDLVTTIGCDSLLIITILPTLVELCDNNIDDDLNGLVDCEDPALEENCCCITPVSPDITGPEGICDGDSVTLSVIDAGYFSITWSTAESGTSISTNTPGLYSVSVEDTCGNVLIAEYVLELYSSSDSTLFRTIDEGDTIGINGVTYADSGLFFQTLENAAGCDSFLAVDISFRTGELCDNGLDDDMDGLIDCEDPDLFDACCCIAITLPDLGPDITAEAGSTVTLTLDSQEEITWSTGATGNAIDVTTPGLYWVEVNHCDSLLRDSVVITMVRPQDCKEAYFVPNVFSPNGDGVNDKWRISRIQSSLDIERDIIFDIVMIFDRWGSILYQAREPLFEWDGTSGANVVGTGVYTYMIRYECDGETVAVAGDITVLH